MPQAILQPDMQRSAPSGTASPGRASMTVMLSRDQVTARADRAVAAATAAGRDCGLSVTEPRLLYDVFSVVVHLVPAPVAVWVPTVLPRNLIMSSASQRRTADDEIDITGPSVATDTGVLADAFSSIVG